MERIVAPGKYIRQAGILAQAASHLEPVGKKAFIAGGKRALAAAGPSLLASLEKAAIQYIGPVWYGGQSSQTNIARMAESVEDADFIIGVGGGRALDAVKALAYQVNLPMVAVPTIASTCAASTPLSAFYSDDGVFLDLSPQAANPVLVLTDSKIVAAAPPRLLASGLGDTLAKWFEVDATFNPDEADTAAHAAHRLARLVYENLQQDGAAALQAVTEKKVTPSLAKVIDTIIFLSGCVSGLGGVHCRTAGAHAIYSGLTIFPQVHNLYHGEIVAFGVLAQAVLEKRPRQELEEIVAFNFATNLPITMDQLGLGSLSPGEWERLAHTCIEIEDMNNMPFPVTPPMVTRALQEAHQLGSLYLQEGKI